ncbi:hypothetical protein Amet_3845 [Alkaliphilus metalliredigens QYMF]|uniref:Uncharacterized protein n=1 Tax=Alkaliphilus metalliredigens (strain QYMF) TaxID=293826 RepID=A6TUU4_ALKMQ|nr:hypothetical protein Amet_3845 [Alkaliphilus metalliredigens QYMF]
MRVAQQVLIPYCGKSTDYSGKEFEYSPGGFFIYFGKNHHLSIKTNMECVVLIQKK